MVLINFWGILGHLVAFNQRYLVSTPICQQPGFLKIYIAYFFQTTWSKNLYFSEFSSQGMIHSYTGKLPKNQIIKQNLAVKSMLFWSYFLRKLDIFFEKFQKMQKMEKKNIFFTFRRLLTTLTLGFWRKKIFKNFPNQFHIRISKFQPILKFCLGQRWCWRWRC